MKIKKGKKTKVNKHQISKAEDIISNLDWAITDAESEFNPAIKIDDYETLRLTLNNTCYKSLCKAYSEVLTAIANLDVACQDCTEYLENES